MLGNDPVTRYIEAGLTATSARQAAIANNIANLGTPGYRRKAVEFEELLAEAVDRGGNLGDLAPRVFEPNQTPVNGDGNDVVLEKEVGDMIRNGGRHKTYIRLLSKLYSQLDMAIRTER